jgi:ABC-type transporter MlaC component
MNARFPLAGLAIALTLSACGGPPSDGDAEKALATLLTQSGAGQITDIQEFQLSGCVEDQDMEGYRCDTTGKVTIDVGGQQVPIPVSKNLRYTKESGTWKAYAK